MQAELEKLNRSYEAKLAAVRQKLARKKSDEDEQRAETDQRKMEEFSASGELLLSVFSKRKRSLSSTLSKRRMAEQARSDLEQIRKDLDALEDQVKVLESSQRTAVGRDPGALGRSGQRSGRDPADPSEKGYLPGTVRGGLAALLHRARRPAGARAARLHPCAFIDFLRIT